MKITLTTLFVIESIDWSELNQKHIIISNFGKRERLLTKQLESK